LPIGFILRILFAHGSGEQGGSFRGKRVKPLRGVNQVKLGNDSLFGVWIGMPAFLWVPNDAPVDVGFLCAGHRHWPGEVELVQIFFYLIERHSRENRLS